MDVSANRELWSYLTVPDPASGTGDLSYFDASLAPLARIEGSKGGYFEAGWLESRRAVRQMYQTRWEEVTPASSDSGSSVLLLGALPATITATPVLPSSVAPVLVGGTEGVLVLLAASRRGLEPLPMLHAALCAITRMATAPGARLVLLSAMRNADAPRNAPHAGLLGLARCVRQEAPLLRLNVLHAADPRAVLHALSAWAGVAEPEVALCVAPVRAQVPRLAPLPLARHGRLQLRLPSRGAIANLKLEAQPDFAAPLGDSEIELEVRAVGLNFRDVINVLGEYPGDPGPPGADCAGIVLQAGRGAAHLRTGTAVLGFSVASLASVARGPAALLAPKPAALSFEAACTLPITWSTVHAALGGARLRRGQAALVHAAAGGVGLVAVEYAQWLGGVVHATAGQPYKHRLVNNLGAVQGGPKAISLSSSRGGAAFARGAARALCGGRLAVVLNSLSLDFISASTALLGEGGAFEEIGKRGVWSAARMRQARAAVGYDVLAIDNDMQQDPPWMQGVLQRLSRRAAAGVLHGLPTQTIDLARRWEAAFRLLQSGRNVGKVV
eukprot:scaffold85826_cov71-Phaeocystis_antarctica.AAC.1